MINYLILASLLTFFSPATVFAKKTSETLVIDAIKDKDLALLNEFIAANGPFNEKDSYNNTPLTHAAYLNNLDAVQALVLAKANIDDANYEGNTALHLAANEGHLAVVQFLTANGANLELQNKRELTAYDLAIEQKRQDVAAFLRKARLEQTIQKKLVPKTEPTKQASCFQKLKNWARLHPFSTSALGGVHIGLASLLIISNWSKISWLTSYRGKAKLN